VRILHERGLEVSYLSVDQGAINLDELAGLLREDTLFVSVMLVNNETGTIFPLQRIVETVKVHAPQALVHSDAVQAFGKIPFTVDELGVDLMSISAHKIGGAKGSGALYRRTGTPFQPTQFGGGQEHGLRSGTEATPLIAAFGVAAEAIATTTPIYQTKVANLRDTLIDALRCMEGVVVNSSKTGAPHIVNFSVPEVSDTWLVEALSHEGFCISNGAACKSQHAWGPTMLMSFGLEDTIADSALRVSFSHENTPTELEQFIATLRRLLVPASHGCTSPRQREVVDAGLSGGTYVLEPRHFDMSR
jgi:cysteine desulfurase